MRQRRRGLHVPNRRFARRRWRIAFPRGGGLVVMLARTVGGSAAELGRAPFLSLRGAFCGCDGLACRGAFPAAAAVTPAAASAAPAPLAALTAALASRLTLLGARFTGTRLGAQRGRCRTWRILRFPQAGVTLAWPPILIPVVLTTVAIPPVAPIPAAALGAPAIAMAAPLAAFGPARLAGVFPTAVAAALAAASGSVSGRRGGCRRGGRCGRSGLGSVRLPRK
jgi:hypothetical protein